MQITAMRIKTFNKSVRHNNLIPAEFFPRGRKQNNKSPEYTPPANIKACITIVAVQNAINCKSYGILISINIKYLYKKSFICVCMCISHESI